MKKISRILVLLILWTPLLFAQGKFTATASKTNVGVGEQFEIDFSINANGEHFVPPDLGALRLLTGPNIATNVNIVKGDTTFDSTYSYIVVAPKEGTFNVGAATIEVSGQTLLSNSLKIEVKGLAPAGQRQIKVPDPFVAEDNSAPVDIKNIGKQLFIRAEADKTHAHVGEQIKVTYKLYTRVNIMSGKVDKAPDLKGFRNHDVPNPSDQKYALLTENVNGLKYRVIIIKQCVVSPEHAGYLTIPTLTMATILEIPEKGAFDNPSGIYHQLKYELKSDPVIIHAF